jgi:prenyltransferase beta subunit
MSFRLEMLQVARLAPKLLGESTELVVRFLNSRLSPTGGFLDRKDEPDLYYTVFGIEGMLSLQQDFPRAQTAAWLRAQFGTGEGLDFVHLCCLLRCWAALDPKALSAEERQQLAARIEVYRTAGGGYHPSKDRAQGSAYGCLLAAAAYEDLALSLPEPEVIKACMDALLCPDGGWTNESFLLVPNAPGTAAALALYRRKGWQVPEKSVQWLFTCHHPEGGFLAFPKAPMPDLLSTAVSLHGLAGAQADLSSVKESCLDYIDSLWSAEGGFHGNWTDHQLDCEYTYYGLLALGHLSL